jgi:hypothetical protein
MAVMFYLYCKETRHGVFVGQSSMGIPCDLAESKSVISLFCLAHQMNDLVVVADPDLEFSWDEDSAGSRILHLHGARKELRLCTSSCGLTEINRNCRPGTPKPSP